MELGGKFWLAMFGMVIGGAIAAVLVFLLLDAAWMRWGAIGMLLFVFVVIGAVAWLVDRRAAQRSLELEGLG